MNETDDTYEWHHELYWHTVRARDDLLPDDAVRVFEMWEGQKPGRIQRYTRKKNEKAEKVRGPHAEVDHETKDAVMGALSPDDLGAYSRHHDERKHLPFRPASDRRQHSP